jgi:uncharacterized repeat protein (TIGR01451 family)
MRTEKPRDLQARLSPQHFTTRPGGTGSSIARLTWHLVPWRRHRLLCLSLAAVALAIMAAPSSAATIQSVDIHTPQNIAGSYAAGFATFGPQTFSVTGVVVLANDSVSPTSDACSQLTDPAVIGKIALIDRGMCTFTSKVKNAQDAGAIGVIIANNTAGPPLTMGGADPTILIPTLSVTLATGNLIKGELGSVVTATLNRFQAPPNSVVLSPPQATNTVGEQHCVTATVTDASGQASENVTVVFSVSGANTAGPEAKQTDVNGQATFCYMGLQPGFDAITAFADTNDNNVQDLGEPSGAAGKTWVLPADLSVAKTDSPDPVAVGRDLTYAIDVTNDGPGVATGVNLTDSLPGSAAFVSASPTCMYDRASHTVTCNLDSLASGASATVTIVVRPLQGGTITNTASVTANEPDPNTANNTDTESTTVHGPPKQPAACDKVSPRAQKPPICP